ncbi:methyltransferase domain-containing protein, partial [Vibrio parahaemolyticus]
SVLIPGCGAAYEVSHFVESGHDVIAMDYSAEAVNLAKSQLGQYQDKVMLGDVFGAEFSQPFDVIYERAFLAALPREMWDEYFAMVERLLPSNGLLVGYFVISDDYRSRFPPFCLRSGELEQKLAANFNLIESAPVTDSVDVFKGKEQWMVWQKK